MKTRSQSAFTLIEILIVVVILGILGMIVLSRYRQSQTIPTSPTAVSKNSFFEAGDIVRVYPIQTEPLAVGNLKPGTYLVGGDGKSESAVLLNLETKEPVGTFTQPNLIEEEKFVRIIVLKKGTYDYDLAMGKKSKQD